MEMGMSVRDIIRTKLGNDTYNFIDQNSRFKRCIDLLGMSVILVNGIKGKLLVMNGIHREYSYIVSPAAKALEGILILIALYKKIITEDDLNKVISIGSLYDDINGKPAKAKSYVLRPKDARLVDKIYTDWYRYRNKTLHYDENYLIDNLSDAERLINEIFQTIKDAYQIFIPHPVMKVPIGTRIMYKISDARIK